ncbi:MAG: amidohydrolase family protein [Bacteroidetes bacterium]|nr:amidohydrolase family protein [Bacteroidota bacterium]MBL0079026.1 amidohydrolase family protein [Bacteroidota bacterium]
MHKFLADIVFPVAQSPIKNGVVITDDKGKIVDITPFELHDEGTVLKFSGAIVPGFINTHCHLELSHLKGKAKTGTGLIDFIKQVVTQRATNGEEIDNAIIIAENEMLQNGIVAVGDISNQTDTFLQKSKGNLRYHTFVECFDFMSTEEAKAIFDKYVEVYEKLILPTGHKKSLVPHANYSVSETLFALINNRNETNSTISIHNQETPAEEDLFLKGESEFTSFFGNIGFKMDDIKTVGLPAIYYALKNLKPTDTILFVHNTLTQAKEIIAAQNLFPKTYWATCPNANLYIENRLPDYKQFIESNAALCIGTDSLTSNWQLSILEEMKTIQQYQSSMPFEIILKWATINGAKALQFDDTLGSIEKGKTPGLVLLENFDGEKLTKNTKAKRLI